MNKDDLRDVVARLEALESLTKLFRNLWFDNIKGEIQDEKVKAYLMVYDDAFPGMDHVVEFVRKNASALSSGDKVQDGFEMLTKSLLNREIETDLDFDDEVDPELFAEDSLEEEELDEELTVDEREALETEGQGDIDALFVEQSADAATVEASNEEIAAFLADEGEELEELSEEEEVEEVDNIGDMLVEEEEVEDEVDLEDVLGDNGDADEELGEELPWDEEDEETVDDLEDLLGDEDEADAGEEEDMGLEDLLEDEGTEQGDSVDDLADLLGEEEEDGDGEGLNEIFDEVEEEDNEADDEIDIGELLDGGEGDGGEGADDVSADISEDEMTALLGDEEEEQEEQDLAASQAKTKAKAKAKKAESGEIEMDDAGNGEESIGQDEIDALFG